MKLAPDLSQLCRLAAAAVMSAVMLAPPAFAQFNTTAPLRQPSADKRDFSGVWTPNERPFYTYTGSGEMQVPPLKGKYAEAYSEVLKPLPPASRLTILVPPAFPAA
jgi:hypothetical protein